MMGLRNLGLNHVVFAAAGAVILCCQFGCAAAGAAPAAEGTSGSPDTPRVLLERTRKLAAEPYDAGTLAATSTAAQGRIKVRPLTSFETDAAGKPLEGFQMDGRPIAQLMAQSEGLDCVYVADKGVTDGKWCARLTAQPGNPWASTTIKGEAFKDWRDYDYFAMDVYADDVLPISVELWDQSSVDYPTRCTVAQAARPGHQTLLFPINRSKRNGKEGRSWNELEDKDKIDLGHLKFIKLIVRPYKDRPLQFWVDNLRLMQEDAAKPKMTVELPKTARAYDFCSLGAVVPGFTAVSAENTFTDERGYGFTEGKDLASAGNAWPDLLTGTYVMAGVTKDGQTPGVPLTFKAKVPNGRYLVWLAAGQVLRTESGGTDFYLKVNDKTLYEDKPGKADYDSEKYLHRFLWTPYSERPHALWLDYVDKMVPVHVTTIDVTDGAVAIRGCNYFLSALILMPADQQADFDRMAAKILLARMKAFEDTLHPAAQKKPTPPASGAPYVVYAPQLEDFVNPASAPPRWGTPEYQETAPRLADAAAPGQNVFWRLAVVPFAETPGVLGEGQLVLSDLTGPDGAVIPAAAIDCRVVRRQPSPFGVGDSVLLPTLSFPIEKGITQSLWLWLRVPDNAKPGQYAGRVTIKFGGGVTAQAVPPPPAEIPISLEVLPIRLERELPVSFGMYYDGRPGPRPVDYWGVIREQLKWMKKAGFTATSLMANAEVVDVQDGHVRMKFDATGTKLLKELGFGQHPGQYQMTGQLGLARALARKMGAKVDQDPGCEFRAPGFAAAYADAIGQYRQFLDGLGVAYACEIVDEPRAVPNPWNRNLADTCRYGDWMAQAGFKTRFVTPMGDRGGDGDYSTLVDHADIISIGAGRDDLKLQERTLATPGKTLWFYNSGLSRYMWGAYPWAVGAKGRWEWHWCFTGEGQSPFPSDEWYCPFAGSGGTASNADPRKYPGGFLYHASLLTAADGITDYAYLYTLQQAVDKYKADPTKADAVKKAGELLAQVKAAVPPVRTDRERERAAVQMLAGWRVQAGRLLVELQK